MGALKALAILCLLAAFAAGVMVERYILRDEPSADDDAGEAFSILTIGETTPPPSENRGRPDGQAPAEGEDALPRPERILAQLLTLPGEHEMHRAIGAYPPGDILHLLAELRATGTRQPQARTLKRVLYHRLARAQPRKALAEVGKEVNSRQLEIEVVRTAFAALAERDLDQATAAFAGLPSLPHREAAVEAMADHLRIDDMQLLANFLSAYPSVSRESLYRRWAERDPGSALAQSSAAAQGPDALRALARGWARMDPDKALTWARAVDADHPGAHVLAGALETLTHIDPARAAGWVGALQSGHRQSEVIRQIARRWAREDLDAALSWTESLSGRSRREATLALAHELARQDPRAAADFALSLPPSEQRQDAVFEVAHRWARNDLGQAVEWANSLVAEHSIPAMRGILETVADDDPGAAAKLVAEWATGNAFDGQRQAYGELAGELADQWSHFDPRAAASWAHSLPEEGDVQRHAVERVAGSWVEQDPMAASEWIGGLPPGEVRDIAAERLVDHVAHSDPDAAFQWAMSVSSPEHQTELLHHVFEVWRETDPRAAQAIFNAALISTEQRQQLGEIFEERR